MKKMNLLVMSLVSAAALTFTSCSSNDDLAGNAGQEKIGEFYMTLTVQTPNANGTRTVQSNKYNATAAESNITSGTFYLVDATGNIVYQKTISGTEFANVSFKDEETGKTQLLVPVQNVQANTEYKVYFLANATDAKPWENVFTATEKFAKPYVEDNKFAMFNENDKSVDGNSYTVQFTDANKDSNNGAKVSGTIKLERLVARIDQPTSEATTIKAYTKEDATDAEKKAMEDARAKVESVNLTGYAISNLANKTNIMQKWNDADLLIPDGITYYQPKSEFGTATRMDNADYFNEIGEDAKNYVFENNNSENATFMYFEYTVKLTDAANQGADCTDGTFYRYNGVIYTSINAIYEAYKDQPVLFGGKSADALKAELKIVDGKITATEEELSAFRANNTIEVFRAGKTYYKQTIKDNFIGYENAIQRNTVYQLNVKNLFNIGADVPNGNTDKKPMYYLDVEVSVNPWVQNTQDVDLK